MPNPRLIRGKRRYFVSRHWRRESWPRSILAPPPAGTPLLPSAVEEYQTNQAVQMQVFAPSETAPGSQEQTEPFKVGPIVVRPHLLYRFLYGNGIQSAPGQPQDSIIQQFSPGILLDIGTHWTLDYTPTLSYYSSSNFRNTVNQDVQFEWGNGLSRLVLHRFAKLCFYDRSGGGNGRANRPANLFDRVERLVSFHRKLSTDLGLNQNFNYYRKCAKFDNPPQSLADSRAWSTMDWLNDQFWPRFNAGIGVGLGYNQQDNSPDSIYEQYQARINWLATDKVSFAVKRRPGGHAIFERWRERFDYSHFWRPRFNTSLLIKPESV